MAGTGLDLGEEEMTVDAPRMHRKICHAEAGEPMADVVNRNEGY